MKFFRIVKSLSHCHFERSEKSLIHSILDTQALGISRRRERSSKGQTLVTL
jgi:hypothetical protein